jgi:hypothetical protein
MISCKSVAELLTSDQLEAQPWWKRMEVRMHLALCGMCSRLKRQLEQLRSGAHELSRQNEADAGLEERLMRRLSGR